MSMLSSMTEKMRETASEVERTAKYAADWRNSVTFGDAARELRDAADTIDYLRCVCNDLQRDYDNLRKAMWDRANARAIDFMTEDELRGLCTDLYDHVDELKALVRDMHTCADRECMCHGCPLDNDARCDFEGRMREAGIEVDDINQNNFQSTKDLVD